MDNQFTYMKYIYVSIHEQLYLMCTCNACVYKERDRMISPTIVMCHARKSEDNSVLRP